MVPRCQGESYLGLAWFYMDLYVIDAIFRFQELSLPIMTYSGDKMKAKIRNFSSEKNFRYENCSESFTGIFSVTRSLRTLRGYVLNLGTKMKC